MIDVRIIKNFDWVLLFLVLILCSVGVLTIYSASQSFDGNSMYHWKQLVWIGIGVVVLFGTSLVDFRQLASFSFFLHIGVIFLLVLVLLWGKGGDGSNVRRWLSLGGYFFQPSEFVKFTLILYLSHYFRDSRRIGNLGWRECFWPLSVTLIPFLLILIQPDLGTALLLFFILGPILFFAGIKYRVLLTSLVLALLSIPLIWLFLLKPYQKKRILTLLYPELDPLGSGYHIIQSKIAVGSGEFWGKGFLQGTQTQLNFLPARHTDFIFSVFSEEWGFVGSLLLLFCYCFLLFWCLIYVGKVRDRSGTILSIGITSILATHIFINIGMVTGLLPIVGMPLPFLSYGGSSMISMMFGVGLLMSVRIRHFS